MRLDVHLSEVEFRRVVAGPLANGRHTRDAVEVIVDGESLALGYDGAPLDVEHV